MSLYGNENILLQLQSTLLQAGNAGKNPHSDAFFRTAYDVLSSDCSNPTCHFYKGWEEAQTDMKIRKYIFAALGCTCLALGTVGVFLPILPTTPFYLLTVFFFANSSQKLHDWFLGTELYQKHLDSFVKDRGMLRSTKISIICTVTLLMGFGFFMMARKGIWIPCVILVIVWLAHIFYFMLRVKTIPDK